MLGKEINDPFFFSASGKIHTVGCSTQVVAAFPNPLDSMAWTDPPPVNVTSGRVTGGNVGSSITLKHFIAYVKGAAGQRSNTTERP